MDIFQERISFRSRGETDILDLTDRVAEAIQRAGVSAGNVLLFVPGATAALTTMEFEPGLVSDLRRTLERIAPRDHGYKHNERWGDENGHAHIRATLLGPSLTVPISGGQMILGTWQQIIFIDFDNRARERTVIVQITGTGHALQAKQR